MRLFLLLAGLLSAAPAAGDRSFDPRAPPARLRDAVDRAERAIRARACSAEHRFGVGDPDENARDCRGAADVPGVKVGRTSARLRDPDNAPPRWARAYVAATDGKKTLQVEPLAFDLGDRVGVLRPMDTRQACLRCHDARERVAASTRAWLARAYPRDRSFGYAQGDLRGFWWAEAPRR